MNADDHDQIIRLTAAVSTLGDNVTTRLDGIIERLGKVNGSMAKHFEDDAGNFKEIAANFKKDSDWQQTHTVAHAQAAGFRKGQLAILAALMSVSSVVAGVLVKVLL